MNREEPMPADLSIRKLIAPVVSPWFTRRRGVLMLAAIGSPASRRISMPVNDKTYALADEPNDLSSAISAHFDTTTGRVRSLILCCAAACVVLIALTQPGIAAGVAERGVEAFRNCAACHSITAGQHMTGPSLANIWGRDAGTAKGFMRYSDALKKSKVVWNEQTLDRWLQDPNTFVPGNEMRFAGIKEQQPRQDLIAFLKAVSEGKKSLTSGMTGNVKINLKNPDPRSEVKSMHHCGDTYFVTTVSGQTHKAWEFNLRLKTDSSDYGPQPGRPVVVGTGMQGDRAAVVFASFKEIGSFIKEACP